MNPSKTKALLLVLLYKEYVCGFAVFHKLMLVRLIGLSFPLYPVTKSRQLLN